MIIAKTQIWELRIMALETINLNDLSLEKLVKMDLTERFINKLPPKTRLEFCIIKLKNENGLSSVSEREDAIIMMGELYYKLEKGEYDSQITPTEITKIYAKISEIFDWAINNETNCVPHHEICYQIASRDMTELIPQMVWVTLHHKSIVSRHEYIECLANIGAWSELESVLPFALKDPVEDIRQTAQFCEDRLRRYRNEPTTGPLDIM